MNIIMDIVNQLTTRIEHLTTTKSIKTVTKKDHGILITEIKRNGVYHCDHGPSYLEQDEDLDMYRNNGLNKLDGKEITFKNGEKGYFKFGWACCEYDVYQNYFKRNELDTLTISQDSFDTEIRKDN